MAMPAAAQKSPDAFRTISEVAEWIEVPQHVLRFWETKFGAVRPLKRGGGRRYYRPDDVDLLRGIRALLYSDGLTIKGVQKILKEQGPRYVMELGRGAVSLIPNLRAVPGGPGDTGDAAFADNISETDSGFERAEEISPEPEPETGLTEAERTRFSLLLNELSDLKERLRAAKKRPGYSA